MATEPIYRFKAELQYYKPRMWRRFLVSKNTTMAELAYILMTMFQADGSHLFSFITPFQSNRNRSDEPPTYYVIPTDWADAFDNMFKNKKINAAEAAVGQAFTAEGEKMIFNYDFGDSWRFTVKLEKIIEDKEPPEKGLPLVTAGAGYGIIEDCGGIGGLEELAYEFDKKSGERYDELREWLGVDELDLTYFNKDEINSDLKLAPDELKTFYESEE